MGWPVTTFTQTYDWAKVANIAAFWAAFNEKLAMAGISPVRLPVAGDDVSCANSDYNGSLGYAAWTPGVRAQTMSDPGYAGRYRYPIQCMQATLQTNGGIGSLFVDRHNVSTLSGLALTYSGGGHGDGTYGDAFNRFLQNYTLHGTNGDQGMIYAGCSYCAAAGQYWWTRKRPARITSSSDTVYDDDLYNTAANAPANGDVAYNDGDRGRKYLRTAGVWGLATDQTASCRLLTGWGFCAPGDYIGPWIWSELYGLMQEMKSTYGSSSFTFYSALKSITDTANDDDGTGHGTGADIVTPLKATATTDFNAASYGASALNLPYAYEKVDYSASTPPAISNADATLTRRRGPVYFHVIGGPPPADLVALSSSPPFNRAIDYYLYTRTTTFGGGTPAYNKLGDSVPNQDTLTLWMTDGPDATARSYSDSSLPSASAAPSWVVSTNTDGGYQFGLAITIARWDVAGGLVYV